MSNFNSPVDGTREDIVVVSVQAKDEAAVDHDAETVGRRTTRGTREVLSFAGPSRRSWRVFRTQRKAPESAAAASIDHIIAQNGVDRCGS